jgi:hypothetical protein
MADRNVAVVTDTTSGGFYFDLWYHYYGQQFGVENLFVVTSLDGLDDFRSRNLGGLWHVTHAYDDGARARTMSSAVSLLLTSYVYVIRVDVDEFLIPDLRKFSGLKDYIDRLTQPYVTARGFNVYEAEGDAPIDFSRQILVKQRRTVRAETAMNKTCITSVPIKWGLGMHFASVYPVFGDIFLFHMKRADVETLVSWGIWMLPKVAGNQELVKYYGQTREEYIAFNRAVLSRPLLTGWDALVDLNLEEQFIRGIKYDAGNKRYRGGFQSGAKCILIPQEFEGVL